MCFIVYLWYVIRQWDCCVYLMTNFQLGRWERIVVNTVSLMPGVIFNRCTWCDLFTSENHFAFLSINVEWLLYSILIMINLGYSPPWLYMCLCLFILFHWLQFFVCLSFYYCSNLFLFIYLYVCFYFSCLQFYEHGYFYYNYNLI